jgi:hypothetical protein
MANEIMKVETPRQKLAQAARQIDIQAAHDGARAAAQTSVLINGGAATAILAFLSTYLTKIPSPPPGIPYAASIALFGYAFGVCLGAWSMWCSSQASAQYGLRWESFLDDTKSSDADERKFAHLGERWVERHRISFAGSVLLFLVSTAVMAWGLR